MKQAAVFAGLAALAAANAHFPHQHHHQHARRGDDGTVTSWDITTEVTVVTTTLLPGQDPSPSPGPPAGAPQGQQGGGQKDAAAPVDASPKADDVNAQAVPTGVGNPSAWAIQQSEIAIQSSEDAVQASINAHQMSINNAPQTGGSAPVQTQQPQPQSQASQPPAQASQTQSQPAQSSPTGGSDSDGTWYTGGKGTYYAASGGYGSCGQELSDDGHTVALAPNFMKASCGKTITIVTGSGQTYTATVADTCPGCAGDPGHIDIVQGWAHQIDPNIDVAGSVPLKWKFN